MGFYIPQKRPLTEEQIKIYKEMLEQAEPYEEESVLQEYDGEPKDPLRLAATIAKKVLDRGYDY